MNDIECSGICKFCKVDFAAACFSGYSDHFYSHPEICNDCYAEASEEALEIAALEDYEDVDTAVNPGWDVPHGY